MWVPADDGIGGGAVPVPVLGFVRPGHPEQVEHDSFSARFCLHPTALAEARRHAAERPLKRQAGKVCSLGGSLTAVDAGSADRRLLAAGCCRQRHSRGSQERHCRGASASVSIRTVPAQWAICRDAGHVWLSAACTMLAGLSIMYPRSGPTAGSHAGWLAVQSRRPHARCSGLPSGRCERVPIINLYIQ